MKKVKKALALAMSLVMLVGMPEMGKVQAVEATNVGEQQIPEGYTPISNIAGLYNIRNNPSGKYILMKDIDMTEDTKEDGDQGSGWTPIENFSGTFDGNGYRIIGMNIYGSVPSGYVGFFGMTSRAATIENLGLVNVNINVENRCVGGIVGRADGSTISSCYCTGVINNSSSAEYACTGGICGSFSGSTGVEITNCFNLSTVSGNAYNGGIFSREPDYTYARYARIENCYNVGSIAGTGANAIGLGVSHGSYGSTIKNNYYLMGSAVAGINNKVTLAGECVALTEAQMKYAETYTGFDFDSVWEIDPYCGYPYPQLRNNRVVRVTSANLQTPPAKLVYNQGDKLDLSGSVLELTYEDGFTTAVPLSEDMLNGYDMNLIGPQTVVASLGGKEVSFGIEVKEIPVSSITIPNAVSINRSETYQMVADILPANASNRTLTWESQDTNIASVDENGLVKAKEKGKTKITVTTANGLTQECEVTVLVASVKITVNPTEVTLKAGESTTLTAQIIPLESTDTITWESTDEKIAEVKEGVVEAKEEGFVIIRAYTESGVKAECEVTVKGRKSETTGKDDMPDIGTVVTLDAFDCRVKVLSNDTKTPTVEYVACTAGYASSIIMPDTVTIGNVSYKVVRIAAGAFKNNQKTTYIIIGSNVTTIGNKAFCKCKALTTIMVSAKVNKIGKRAFYGCKKLQEIMIKTAKLTNENVGSEAFKGIHPKATIKVPKKKLSSYKKLLKKKGVGSKVKIKK